MIPIYSYDITMSCDLIKINPLYLQALTAFQPKDYNLISANKTCNKPKNRSQQFVPVECSRVHLTPKPGVEGSDYINASWCLGEYIILKNSK